VQEYDRGVPTGEVKKVGKAEGHGTTVTFMADAAVFGELNYSFDILAQRFREMAYLTKGLRIKFVDDREDRETAFYFDGGIVSFVRHLNANRGVINPQPVSIDRLVGETQVEVALQYNEGFAESVYAF